MYKFLIRPLLFRFDPENIHHMIMAWLKKSAKIPGVPSIIKKTYSYSSPSLERKVFGLTFPNPVGLAAGFDKNAEVYNEMENLGFGFVEIGTVTPKAQPGNPKPRIFRLVKDMALINRMGFNNGGVEAAVQNLKKRKTRIIIGGNIGKNTSTENCDASQDYNKVFDALYPYCDYFVVNVSCPNIEHMQALQEKEQLKALLKGVINIRNQKETRKPVLVKISPDLNLMQVDDIISIVSELEMDGIVASNTSSGRSNLTTAKSEIEKIGHGGLSGAPLKDASLGIIRYINQKTNGRIPIIASGGIMTPEDAMERLLAGASLIQIYTGFIYQGPGIVKQILKTIE